MAEGGKNKLTVPTGDGRRTRNEPTGSRLSVSSLVPRRSSSGGERCSSAQGDLDRAASAAYRRTSDCTGTSQGAKQKKEKGAAKAECPAWHTDFDALLNDELALRLFRDFLLKEFSAENIQFYTACNDFKMIEDNEERLNAAKSIYQNHLSAEGIESVNIDSGARQAAKEDIRQAELRGDAPVDLFNKSQKQIYNLMKMDSFPRFIHSAIFKEHVEKAEKENGLVQKEKKAGRDTSTETSSRRWNLNSAWTNLKASRTKDREALSVNNRVGGNLKRTISSPDLASFAKTCPDILLCRLVFPDRTCAMIDLKEDQTMEQLINTTLLRRGEHRGFHAYLDNGEMLDMSLSSEIFEKTTVHLEWCD